MRFKIIMDSGVVYHLTEKEIKYGNPKTLFYNLFLDKEGLVDCNNYYLDEGKVFINPRHISSIETEE